VQILIDFWNKDGEKNYKTSDKEIIDIARYLLKLTSVLTDWSSIERFPSYGPIYIGVVYRTRPQFEETLQKAFKEKYNIDIIKDKERYEIVYVPRQLLGSATYVAFEKI
jgi:hypothetical protein